MRSIQKIKNLNLSTPLEQNILRILREKSKLTSSASTLLWLYVHAALTQHLISGEKKTRGIRGTQYLIDSVYKSSLVSPYLLNFEEHNT